MALRMNQCPMQMQTCEVDFEIALLMGYDPRLKNGRCMIGSPEVDQGLHGDHYHPSRNWHHAIPAIEHFKISIIAGDLETSMRRFLLYHHESRVSA